MTESKKVKKWFDSELSMRPEESLDSVECEEAKEICLKALEEREQYRAIGTVPEFAKLKEKATAKKPIETKRNNLTVWDCPKCGNELYSGQKFCDECGNAIADEFE